MPRFQRVTAASVVMYHGTSAKYLRSILKHGLKAQPPEHQFTTTSRDYDPEDATYGGAYLTPDLHQAKNYASGAARRNNSDELLVVVRIQTRTPTIVPDEDVFLALTDPFVHQITDHLKKQMGWTQALPIDVLDQESHGRIHLEDWVEPWLKQLNQDAQYRGIQVGIPLLLRYKKSLAKLLRLIFQYDAVKFRPQEDWEREVRRRLRLPPDRATARQNFVQQLDYISQKVQRLTDPQPKLRVRSLVDIGFQGSNRILGILSYHYPEPLVLDGTVVYGARNPETRDAIVQFGQHLKRVHWKTPDGQTIYLRGSEQVQAHHTKVATQLRFRGQVYRLVPLPTRQRLAYPTRPASWNIAKQQVLKAADQLARADQVLLDYDFHPLPGAETPTFRWGRSAASW